MLPVPLLLMMMMTAVAGWFQLPPIYDPDRLSPKVMEKLVAAPIRDVRAKRIDRGIAKFEKLRARTKGDDAQAALTRADLDESFGVLVYAESLNREPALHAAAALPFLKRAVESYRIALGSGHPEVALALHSWADALRAVDPVTNAAQAREAYCKAFRIRLDAFGPADPITGSALAEALRLAPQSIVEPEQRVRVTGGSVPLPELVVVRDTVAQIRLKLATRDDHDDLYRTLASDQRLTAICSTPTR